MDHLNPYHEFGTLNVLEQYNMLTSVVIDQNSDHDVWAPSMEDLVGSSIVSLSTEFRPDILFNGLEPDTMIISSDQVLFFVHYHKLKQASETDFANLLSRQTNDSHPPMIQVQQNAVVLNVMMHALYDMPCNHYNPTLDTIISALEALKTYGVPLIRVLQRKNPTYNLFLGKAPLQAIRALALACENKLEDLAVAISPHLLGYPMSDLTDELAVRIGPQYMRRLYVIQHNRLKTLRDLLLAPPFPHAPTPQCGFMDQKALLRAWTLASAQLAWDARPDISTQTIRGILEPLQERLNCDLCRKSLYTRINHVSTHWSLADITI